MPGSVVDVKINIAGPSTANAGDPFTYTVVIGNNALPDADGAPFSIALPSGAVEVGSSCSASDGAACPAVMTTSNTSVSGLVQSLPHLGVVTITVTGRFGVPSPTTVTAAAQVEPPEGTTDSDTSSNTSSVSTAMNNTTDLQTTKSQSVGTIAPGSPVTYTVTFTNVGPAAADGASIVDRIYQDTGLFASYTLHVISCTTTGGLTCQGVHADGVLADNGRVVSAQPSFFPANSSMTVIYTLDPVLAVSPPCGQLTTTLRNSAETSLPFGMQDTNGQNDFASTQATSPGPGACPEADLQVVKTQSADTIAPGSPVTYTATITNAGPSDADGAYLSDSIYVDSNLFSAMTLHVVSCTTTGGMTCPTLRPDGPISTIGPIFSGNVASFPANSSFELVYTLDPVANPNPRCGPLVTNVYNQLYADTPDGIADPNRSDNAVTTIATAPGPGACPAADLQSTKTQSSNTITPGSPITYTATFTNAGPTAADGAYVSDHIFIDSSLFSSLNLHVISCTATGGMTCPEFHADGSLGTNGYLFSITADSFPANSGFTVVYTIDPVLAAIQGCPSSVTTLYSSSYMDVPEGIRDPDFSNNSGSVTATAICADIAVNKSVTPSSAQAGDPVSYAIQVSNSASTAVHSSAFADPLPSGFIYGAASCTANSGASTCGAVNYDPGSRTVTSTIPTIGPNLDFVTITITGTAGTTPNTYVNAATVLPTPGPDVFLDPNLASNTSNVSLQVFNTSSTIVVTKNLTGLPAGGVPVPLTFTGTITCGTQGAKPWSATIPAGQTTAVASPVAFFDGESCTIQEDPSPELPDGFAYAGPAVIAPTAIPVLGPSATEQVVSTSALTPVAALSLVKTVDRSIATAGDILNYSFQVTNGSLVDVADLSVSEVSFSGSGSAPTVTCPTTTVASHASVTCSASYVVTADDVVAGSIVNVARATGTPASGPVPVSNDASVTVAAVEPPAISVVKSASPLTVTAAGQIITYSFDVTNTGGTSLTGIVIGENRFSGTGPVPSPSCPSDTLAAGASQTCSATYVVTQADMDAGSISNAAVTSGTAPDGFANPVSPESEVSVTAQASPSLSLVKSVAGDDLEHLVSGSTVTYSFVVTNSGNVTVSAVQITEQTFTGFGTVPDASCPDVAMAPGQQTVCQASYVIAPADVVGGSIQNTAVATGISANGPDPTSDPSSVTLPQTPEPSLTLEKTASLPSGSAAGASIDYSFLIVNTGNVNLAQVAVVEGAFTGSGTIPGVTCPDVSVQLLPGQSRVCSSSYVITDADVRQGSISNTATATGEPGGVLGTATSDPSTAEVQLGSAPGTGALGLTKSAEPDDVNANGVTDPGDTVRWTLVVTNIGDVDLTGITVDDPTAGAISCRSQSVAVGASVTCTSASIVITQADADRGVITNTAVAHGVDPSGAAIASPSATASLAVSHSPSHVPTPPSSAPPSNGAPYNGNGLPGTGTDAAQLFWISLAVFVFGMGLAVAATRRRGGVTR